MGEVYRRGIRPLAVSCSPSRLIPAVFLVGLAPESLAVHLEQPIPWGFFTLWQWYDILFPNVAIFIDGGFYLRRLRYFRPDYGRF